MNVISPRGPISPDVYQVNSSTTVRKHEPVFIRPHIYTSLEELCQLWCLGKTNSRHFFSRRKNVRPILFGSRGNQTQPVPARGQSSKTPRIHTRATEWNRHGRRRGQFRRRDLRQELVQEIVKLVGKLGAQLKDLSDTFAIQTTNAKKLGLTTQELETRKAIVESNHKSFESMRENFVYLIKDDPAIHRTSKERNHTLNSSKRAFEPITMDAVRGKSGAASPPPLSAVGLSAFAVESDSDDELEIRHYKKEGEFAIGATQGDSELGPLQLTMHRSPGPLTALKEWVTRNRRNKMIFAGSNITVIVLIIVFMFILI